MEELLKRNQIIWIFIVLIASNVFVWAFIFFPAGVKALELDFLDVGQGDGELIHFPGGVDVLIDGGKDSTVLQSLSRVLPFLDRRIDLVMMTHPQLDHFGGLIDVLRYYQVGMFVGSGRGAPISSYKALLTTLEDQQVQSLALGAGDSIRYGDYVLRILGPSKKNLGSKELNDTSLVVMLEYQGFKALYTGDIGFLVEGELVKEYDLDADVLKVPHHGSRFSSGESFLKQVSPRVAVIEVGKNSYGHPTPAALSRLETVGARIFRTDRQGTVRIVLKDSGFDVMTER